METTFCIDTTLQLARVFMRGNVGGDDLLQVGALMYQHPDWQSGYREFWDGQELEGLNMEWDDFKMMAEMEEDERAWIGLGQVAMLVIREVDVAAAMAFKALMQASGRPMKVCRTEAEVMAWLDVPYLPELPDGQR